MTESAVVYTDHTDSTDAGRVLGMQIAEAIHGTPDVVILFAAPTYDQVTLLEALKRTCRPSLLVGCSSAGEFTNRVRGEGMVSAVALRSEELLFSLGVGREVSKNRQGAAQSVVSTFHGTRSHDFKYSSAIVLVDALAGHTDDLIEQMTLFTRGSYQFLGGGAGDNAQFSHTPVFYGTEVLSDAVVALEILSNKPVGIGAQHGWRPASASMLVTGAKEMRLDSINGKPAVRAFQAHAEATGQTFNIDDPLSFFLHNIIGIDVGGGYKLRVPLSVVENGSILCAAEVPERSTLHIMRTTLESGVEAATRATNTALRKLYGGKPAVTLFFDCVATRLRMGRDFGFELDSVKNALSSTPFVGCNTHGQIARAEGQFSGFHNCNAVVCVIPQ